MFNKEKLLNVIREYKADFKSIHWKDEMYKWEAVRHFQDHWDIKAADFCEMFMQATDKTSTLLASMNNYPRGMIKQFAEADPEATRAMFIDLFDETKNLSDRIDSFQIEAEKLRSKYGTDEWKQHYQNANSISTYLWLRYPDKYYIYKYSEVRAVAKELESDFFPKKGRSADNIIGSFKLYDEIRDFLALDGELVDMLQSSLTDSCHPDPALKTLTYDVAFYISRYYLRNGTGSVTGWFPADYTPGLSVDDWTSLLNDETVFNETSLKIMKSFYDYGGTATCKQLSVKYGESSQFYNMGSTQLAKRVADKTNCPLLTQETGDTKLWPVLYLGRAADADTDGEWVWRLRDELSEALEQYDFSEIDIYAKDKTCAYTKEDFLNEVYMSEDNYDILRSLLEYKKNIILQGAPGVGKTFAAKRLAYSIMGKKDDNYIEFVQFHQNYSYEDFIMGYKPNGSGFELKYGVFYRFCQKASNQPDKPFFFIIDEINRGNMSKIFGELLMLIEKDYRNTKVTLTYNGLPFSVPENLYIIGMMNTADRSLSIIDYALRRRFSFVDMEPGFNSEGFKKYQKKCADETFDSVISLIIELNMAITSDKSLGKGFCIGHSYFCGYQSNDNWLTSVINYDIVPMLNEYWFDDPQKVQKWTNLLRGACDD